MQSAMGEKCVNSVKRELYLRRSTRVEGRQNVCGTWYVVRGTRVNKLKIIF